jgi:hypothetical protein
LRELASKAGLTDGHLLITDTPKMSSPTTEQHIRGTDGAADWIVLLSGYDPEVLQEAASKFFSPSALGLAGADERSIMGRYKLAFTMSPQDVALEQEI